MIRKILSLCPLLEVLARSFFFKHPKLKEKIKVANKRTVISKPKEFNAEKWQEYSSYVKSLVHNNDILLVHSSMDGLNRIGASTENVLELLLSFLDKGCTIVLPAYAVGSSKIIDGKLKKYDPIKSPCWTGMLPNYFLRTPGAIRTVFPYNSLAAIGPLSNAIMENNDLQKYVYGENSAWKYCVDHHAKLLFIGTTADDSNTIQSHMVADVMGDEWPIANWYQEVTCPVKVGEEVIEKKIFVQKEQWARYNADYHITRRLKNNGILHEQLINGCPIGYVEDSCKMLDYLISLANKNILSYIVPQRYRRGGKSNEYRKQSC